MRSIAFVTLALLLLHARTSFATAVTVCAYRSGVIVSADSKLTVIGNDNAMRVNKIVPVGDHAVVTLVGVAVWSELKYDFWSWTRRVTSRLKGNPAPSDLAELLRMRASELFAHRGGELAKPGMGTYFVVAGLDTDGVGVWEVHVVPDGQNVNVVKTRKFGPQPDDRMFGYGFPASLPFDDKRSPLWAAVRSQVPPWLLRLGMTQQMNVYQRASMCGIPIAVAAEHDPHIAQPIDQALVTPQLGVLIRTWARPSQVESGVP